MYTDGTYPVIRCGQCSLIQPHEYRLCPRCGAAAGRLAYVSRRQVESAALEFFVRAERITLSREKAVALGAEDPVAVPRLAGAWLADLGRRVQTVVSAIAARTA